MRTIYENTVKGVGDLASAFAEEKTIILFGDSAPDTLKDYCYSIDVTKGGQRVRGSCIPEGRKEDDQCAGGTENPVPGRSSAGVGRTDRGRRRGRRIRCGTDQETAL